jgi:hypothetical protein
MTLPTVVIGAAVVVGITSTYNMVHNNIHKEYPKIFSNYKFL